VLKEHGIAVPADVNVKVVEDPGKTVYAVLPARPDELSPEELARVAGGYWSPTGAKPGPNFVGAGIPVWWYGGYYLESTVDPRQ
jgi:hypothetical protein